MGAAAARVCGMTGLTVDDTGVRHRRCDPNRRAERNPITVLQRARVGHVLYLRRVPRDPGVVAGRPHAGAGLACRALRVVDAGLHADRVGKEELEVEVGGGSPVEIDPNPGVGVGLVGLVVLAAAEEAEPLLGDGVRRGARGVVELEEQLLRAALRLAPRVREGPAAGGDRSSLQSA